MYKISFIVLLVAVACSAIPLENQVEDEYEVAESHGDRHARATCDLLSFSAGGVSAGHSACAAHCLVLGNGYRGGRCIDGVCNCRK